jgi:hypothetical protein
VHSVLCYLVKVHKEKAPHPDVVGKRNTFISLLNILHQSDSSLRLVEVESETSFMNFLYSRFIGLLNFDRIFYPCVILTGCISHLQNNGALSYECILNVGALHYVM